MSLSLCSASELIRLNQSKEFTLLASGIKKNLIYHAQLNSPEKLFWEYLYEEAKFNSNLEVKLSIGEMADTLHKSGRTISRYLSKLKKFGYLEIIHNYNSIGQTISTYYVRVPIDVIKTVECTKDRTQPTVKNYDGLPQKQELTPHDKFGVRNTRDLNNSNNVISFSEAEFLSSPSESSQEADEVVEIESFAKPVSEDRQVTLHHILQGKTVVENALAESLTAKQKAVVIAVLSYWQNRRKISNITEALGWIEHQIMRKESFRETSFLGRLSIINKLLREGIYSKPKNLYAVKKAYQDKAQAMPQPTATELLEKERQRILVQIPTLNFIGKNQLILLSKEQMLNQLGQKQKTLDTITQAYNQIKTVCKEPDNRQLLETRYCAAAGFLTEEVAILRQALNLPPRDLIMAQIESYKQQLILVGQVRSQVVRIKSRIAALETELEKSGN